MISQVRWEKQRDPTDHRDNSPTPTKLCYPTGVSLYERETLPGCFVSLFGQTELGITVSKVKQKLSMREEKGRRERGRGGWTGGWDY